MRKRIINRVRRMLPIKMIRREQFFSRIKNRKRHHQRYNLFTYDRNHKASRFNRWQDYKRLIDRSY